MKVHLNSIIRVINNPDLEVYVSMTNSASYRATTTVRRRVWIQFRDGMWRNLLIAFLSIYSDIRKLINLKRNKNWVAIKEFHIKEVRCQMWCLKVLKARTDNSNKHVEVLNLKLNRKLMNSWANIWRIARQSLIFCVSRLMSKTGFHIRTPNLLVNWEAWRVETKDLSVSQLWKHWFHWF